VAADSLTDETGSPGDDDLHRTVPHPCWYTVSEISGRLGKTRPVPKTNFGSQDDFPNDIDNSKETWRRLTLNQLTIPRSYSLQTSARRRQLARYHLHLKIYRYLPPKCELIVNYNLPPMSATPINQPV